MTPQVKFVTLTFTDGDIPSNLLAFRDWLDAKIESLPPAARAKAAVELDVSYSYGGSSYGELRIDYTEPKTPEEITKDKEAKAAATARQLAYLKQQVAKLEGGLQ